MTTHAQLSRFFSLLSLFAVFACALPVLHAKTERWTDGEGKQFKGEAMEVFGPFALFKTSGLNGRTLPLDALTPEDCVRFYRQTKDRPARAADWQDAKADVSWELLGRVMKLEGGKLVPVKLAGRPEPAAYVVFYCSHSAGGSWGMLGNAIGGYHEIQRAMPGVLEGLSFGVRHTRKEHEHMAVAMNIPWLATDVESSSNLVSLRSFTPPPGGYSLMALSRDGVPLMVEAEPDPEKTKQFMTGLKGMLELLRPENPKTWKARAHYYRAVQPVIFADGQTGPLLIGDPLLPEALRRRHVLRFNARMQIAADGKVSSVSIEPGAQMPEAMKGPLEEALAKSSVFVGAVEKGRFVEGEYLHRFDANP